MVDWDPSIYLFNFTSTHGQIFLPFISERSLLVVEL